MSQLIGMRAMEPIVGLDDFQNAIQVVDHLLAKPNRTPIEQAYLNFQAAMLDIYES